MTFKEKISELHEMLQKAIELEFATIPPYLTAAFSITPNSNRSSFAIIHSVYMEEMLHLVLAANVLNAVNGKIKLTKDTIPEYPLKLEFKGKTFKQREFYVHLEKFSKSSIYTFMRIEMPEYLHGLDKFKTAVAELEVPGFTIGEFYELIKSKIKNLCETYGEDNVFTGDPKKQIGEEYYWAAGGKAFEVLSMKDALHAIDLIVEQGEGASDAKILNAAKNYFIEENEVAHFFRFNEIYVGKKYKQDDDPTLPPTGAKLVVNWNDVYPIKKNCKSSDFKQNPALADLNNRFNLHFTLMLRGIEEALDGKRETLFSAIMNDMHGMVKIANQMVQIPIDANAGSETGAPTFELVDLNS